MRAHCFIDWVNRALDSRTPDMDDDLDRSGGGNSAGVSFQLWEHHDLSGTLVPWKICWVGREIRETGLVSR